MKIKKKVLTYERAKKLIQANGIKTRRQYWEFRKSTPELRELLPFDFVNFWGSKFEGNGIFFNTEMYTYDELLEVCAKNELYNMKDYRDFKKNSDKHRDRMPFEPKLVYTEEWKGWPTFFSNVHSKSLKSKV